VGIDLRLENSEFVLAQILLLLELEGEQFLHFADHDVEAASHLGNFVGIAAGN
jgi:hypothetical protein